MTLSFNSWITCFISEKDLDTDMMFDVEGPSGVNIMDYNVVIQAMFDAPQHEKDSIKKTIIKIDFMNGDVLHYFRHLAHALAI